MTADDIDGVDRDHVATAPHEVRGHLKYDEYGLSPYWTLCKAILYFDGDHPDLEVDVAGETFTVSVGYQDGGVAPRDGDPVDDRLWEIRIAADGQDERKPSWLLQPRFPNMKHYESGDPIAENVDWEGVNARIEGGANLNHDEYPRILHKCVQAVGEAAGLQVRDDYLHPDHLREDSVVTTAEEYVRVSRSMGDKLLAQDGILRRFMDLFCAREGSHFEYDADNSKCVGWNHELKFPREDARELLSGFDWGVVAKLYYPEHPDAHEPEDPLYHPKLGVRFEQSQHGFAADWSEMEQIRRDLEELLVNILAWGNVPTEPSTPPFISDDHFSVQASDQDVGIDDDPTPKVEAKQEHKFVTVVRDLTDSDADLLRSLVTDGGARDVDELADDTGWSTRTIYRAIQRLGDVVDHDSVGVRISSQLLAEKIRSIVDDLEERVTNTAKALAEVADMDERHLEEKGSAFQRWVNQYLVDAELQEDGTMRLEIETKLSRLRSSDTPTLAEVLEYGRRAWARTGRDPLAFLEGTFVATVDGETVSGRVKPALD